MSIQMSEILSKNATKSPGPENVRKLVPIARKFTRIHIKILVQVNLGHFCIIVDILKHVPN